MIRNLIVSGILCLASAGAWAQAFVIENFENTANLGNWQLTQSSPPNHTLNATTVGDVPQYVTSGTANLAGQFTINWVRENPSAGTANPYNPGGPLTYYAARFNINAPSSLPNNLIPTQDGLLQADLVNESAYPVRVALVVDSPSSSQLERGPLVTIAGGESLTYVWDFSITDPVGFDTGDSVFSGPAQRVKSLLVYSEDTPAADQLQLKVDNIRHGREGQIPTRPSAPVPVSLIQTGPGSALFSWDEPSQGDVTGYHVYVATDEDFGASAINRLAFPATPEQVVAASETSAQLDNLPADTNLYVAVTAVNESEASPRSQAFAIRLGSGGSGPVDRIVMDNDEYEPGDAMFALSGYAHGVVYTAQALGGLNRAYDSVSAAGVASGLNSLPSDDEAIVVWSNLLDGISGPAITETNLARIHDHAFSGGNIIVSGTHVASSLAAASIPMEDYFHATLQHANIGLSQIQPNALLGGVPALSTVTNIFSDTAAYATTENDAIAPHTGAVELASFQSVPRSTGLSAATGYLNRIVLLGFAFESVASEIGPEQSADLREAFMEGMINYLLSPTAAADWQLFE